HCPSKPNHLLVSTMRMIGAFCLTLPAESNSQHSHRPSSALVTRLIVSDAWPSFDMFQCLRWLALKSSSMGLLFSIHWTEPPGVTTEQGMSTLSPAFSVRVNASDEG